MRNLYLIIISIVIITTLCFSAFRNKGSLHVVFLDVGQGDSIFIRTPSNKTILIDGGGDRNSSGDDSIGTRVIIPFLRSEGVNKLDLVVLSHPHDDHIKGLIPVLSAMPVATVLDPSVPFTSRSYSRFLEIVQSKKISYKRAIRGQIIDFNDGVQAQILNPPQIHLNGTDDDINNNSIVIRLLYKNTSFLLMGDAGMEAEQDIVSSGADIRCDVLKVGHHGSTSALDELFLTKCRAHTAVISVGRNNSFGHPAREVLDKLHQNSIKVLRTDQHGAIVLDL
ncbi:MAG: ComEC/Rec2 family competence protein [Armatimonadota bacterium]